MGLPVGGAHLLVELERVTTGQSLDACDADAFEVPADCGPDVRLVGYRDREKRIGS